MAIETLSKEALRAVQHFEDKLSFEWSPIGLNRRIKEKEQLQIIDLRTKEFYEAGHVPGAQNVLYEDLQKHFSKLDKEKPTVVYCYNLLCNLAAKAALLLAQNGFNVKELVGGFDEYKKAELTIETKAGSESKAQGSSCSTSKGSSCS
jgi:rhodanese-related sulfurtransferase